MKKIMLALLLFLSQHVVAGDVEFPPMIDINPDTITTSTEIEVGYNLFQPTCLVPRSNDDGLTHFTEIDGNNIKLTFLAGTFSPCTILPIPDYNYLNIGTLPAGEYTITLFHSVVPISLPPDPSENLGQYGEPITFNVLGTPQSISVPAFSFTGLSLLLVLVLLIARRSAKMLRKTSYLMLFGMVFSSQSSAAIYHVLLSSDSNAPTADEVVAESLISPAPPIPLLDSFLTAPPEKVSTLVSIRATGHFLDLINSHPNWSYSKLYRYLVLEYPESVNEEQVRLTLLADQYIDNVYLIEPEITVVPLRTPTGDEPEPTKKTVVPTSATIVNSHLTDLNVLSAWELSEGMGYIGAVDVGLQTDHPNLRAFDQNGNYLGGNLLDGYYQIDVGEGDLNIDSAQPTSTGGLSANEGCDLADGVDDDMAVPTFVGHGTHAAGLIAAKNGAVDGICKNCGFSMMKFFYHNRCFQRNPNEFWWLIPSLGNPNNFAEFVNKISDGLSILTNLGMGVVNYSGGLPQEEEDFCTVEPNYPICLVIENSVSRNVLITGANGNNRKVLNLPASDERTMAVGGLHDNGNFWNESPLNGDYTNNTDFSQCPSTNSDECGSNFSYPQSENKTDVVTRARSLYSTFYQGGVHNPFLGDTSCSDDMDGVPDDGYGICTGTSMSAPQAASILQLMRSAHPLLPNGSGNPDNLVGLMDVFNYSSSRSQNGVGHNIFFGYGLPDARLALENILGKSNGEQVKNRLTPMFVVKSDVANNHVYTPFPQVATAFLIANSAEYLPDTNAPLVNEFNEFWYDTTEFSFPAPRADFYVFTTNNNPFLNLKNMVPLRRMEKTINGNNRNDTYAVSTAEIEAFHTDGYNYAGIEGYIYPTCLAEPGCIPANMHKLYRVVDDVNFNHTLVNLPINDPAPANSTKLGYVFPNVDTDGDGLIDGQERILGTLMGTPDTDGDGMTDGFEYPPAGLPFSDPLISDIIFEDGFE
ncbi:MAG: S8/S53 family peptidase [Xanthomonadales bacterium]|nr:S8/S53 family peptidase [Xanthomonadales bacterium]